MANLNFSTMKLLKFVYGILLLAIVSLFIYACAKDNGSHVSDGILEENRFAI